MMNISFIVYASYHNACKQHTEYLKIKWIKVLLKNGKQCYVSMEHIDCNIEKQQDFLNISEYWCTLLVHE